MPTDAAGQVERAIARLADAGAEGIVTAGRSVLRAPAAPLPDDVGLDARARLSTLMLETMHAAPGVGLAGPQIDLGYRIAVIGDRADVAPEISTARRRAPVDDFVLINPHWRPAGDAKSFFYEGCLSVPGIQAVVGRYDTVEVEYATVAGDRVTRELSGWAARIVQHECDHLDGRLYVERAIMGSITTNENYASTWNVPDLAAAARALRFTPSEG